MLNRSLATYHIALLSLLPLALSAAALAQTQMSFTSGTPTSGTPSDEPIGQRLAASPIAHLPVDPGSYILGRGDMVSVRIFGADDMPAQPVEVGGDGKLDLPMVGPVPAAGMTVLGLQSELTKRYAVYFKQPQVTVSVTAYRSQPVTVMGAVNTPHVIDLRGPTRLMDVISEAGGLKPDAGDKITITRPASDQDGSAGSREFSTQVIDLDKIINGTDPNANVLIHARDLITVPKARMVYVVGDVTKPGGYVLDGVGSLSVLQAIALAGGTTNTSAMSKVRILRAPLENGAQRTETRINLKKIMADKDPDPSLHADDILFVPNSTSKNAGLHALEVAANIGTGLAIWRF
jgi:polysaccharide biosynthesis/export protein